MRGKIIVPADRPGGLSPFSVWVAVVVALLVQAGPGWGACNPVLIVNPPESVTVPSGCRATLTVEVTGTGPITYQWRSNGQNVPGATNADYTTPPLSLKDSESFYSVLVSNECSYAASGNAIIFVNTDPIPPALTGASAGTNLQEVLAFFHVFACSGPGGALTPASAQNIQNYALSGGLTILSAQLLGGTTVLLRTTPQLPGASYSLTVNNIFDQSGAAVVPNSQATFGALAPTPGFLRRDVYTNIAGLSLSDLTNHAKFPNLPDRSGFQTAFEAPSDVGDNYGQRLSGYLLPPVSGDYIFYLAADEQAALFLSSDENPAHKTLILYGGERVAWRHWVEFCPGSVLCVSNSVPIPLEAGRRYYVEAIMKEAFSSDHLGVNWQPPGEPVPTNGAAGIRGEYLAAYADPNSIAISIAQQPQSVGAEEGHTATFRVIASAAGNTPLLYQWLRNGVIIPGAQGASYRTDLLSFNDQGARFSVILTVPGGSLASEPATLSVLTDITPPLLLSARRDRCGPLVVEAEFDWLLHPVTATNVENYSINQGVTILGSVLGEDGRRVRLTIDGMNLSLPHQLTVNGVQDLLGNRINVDTTVPITLTGSAFAGTGLQNMIVVECEHFDANRSQGNSNAWTLEAALPGHAGSGYMTLAPDLGLSLPDQPGSYTNGPQLDYCLSFPVAGVYYLWLRGSTPDGLGNSVHAGLNGVSDVNFYRRIGNNVVNWGNNPTAFGWVNDSAALAARIVVPSAGLHTFNLWMREDGVRLDRFLLTTDAEFTFANRLEVGPPESTRDLPEPPSLRIMLSGSRIILQWDGHAILESSDEAAGGWQTATGAVSPYETSPIGSGRFFRLRLP